MASCSRCSGSGRWNGRAGYQCFACNGAGVARVRVSGRARAVAAAASSGGMLQVDAMPTLSAVAAHRASAAAAVVARLGVVGRMGPGAQRLRAAALVRSCGRCLDGTFCPAHNLVDVPASTAERAAQAGYVPLVSGLPPTRPLEVGRPRTYAELFPEDAS